MCNWYNVLMMNGKTKHEQTYTSFLLSQESHIAAVAAIHIFSPFGLFRKTSLTIDKTGFKILIYQNFGMRYANIPKSESNKNIQ